MRWKNFQPPPLTLIVHDQRLGSLSISRKSPLRCRSAKTFSHCLFPTPSQKPPPPGGIWLTLLRFASGRQVS